MLKEALAELYLADGQHERALALHLELGRPAVLTSSLATTIQRGAG